jgi:exonuclease III
MSFSNVHGIRSTKSSLRHSLSDVIAAHCHFDIQVIGISEHHLPLANSGYKQKVHEAVQQGPHSGRIAYQLNSSQEQSTHADGRLMGGTGIIAVNDMVGRLEPGGKGGDSMGRWSYMHIRRHRRAPITIISVYQVCLNPTNKLGQTAWHQQRRALDLCGNTSHPRLAFMQDLEAIIQRLQAQKHDIIVGGDWNESIGVPNSRLLKLCTSLDLMDPWLTFYPHHTEFPTFELGVNRIDSILVSRRILPSIERIGYSPVGGIFTTDHRTVMLEFNTKNLFGNATDPLPAMISRGVRTKDLRSVTKFITSMHSHLVANNAFKRATTLTDTIVDASHFDLVENLDRLIGEAGDQGDKRYQLSSKKKGAMYVPPYVW